jgi:hypothetical protein
MRTTTDTPPGSRPQTRLPIYAPTLLRRPSDQRRATSDERRALSPPASSLRPAVPRDTRYETRDTGEASCPERPATRDERRFFAFSLALAPPFCDNTANANQPDVRPGVRRGPDTKTAPPQRPRPPRIRARRFERTKRPCEATNPRECNQATGQSATVGLGIAQASVNTVGDERRSDCAGYWALPGARPKGCRRLFFVWCVCGAVARYMQGAARFAKPSHRGRFEPNAGDERAYR